MDFSLFRRGESVPSGYTQALGESPCSIQNVRLRLGSFLYLFCFRCISLFSFLLLYFPLKCVSVSSTLRNEY